VNRSEAALGRNALQRRSIMPKPRKPGLVVDDSAYSCAERAASISEDKYTCRICFEESEDSSQLISPCLCKGTLTYGILGSK
jgi:hypothetical protein